MRVKNSNAIKGLLHPLPSRVPKPTKNPPTTKPSGDTIGTSGEYPMRWSFVSVGLANARYSLVVMANAAIKHSFHRFLDCVNVALGATTNDDAKPEAPRISPLKSNSVPADKPIRHPPRRPVAGVKELSDMN